MEVRTEIKEMRRGEETEKDERQRGGEVLLRRFEADQLRSGQHDDEGQEVKTAEQNT